MGKIKLAIVGVGNCASALVQGIHAYGRNDSQEAVGLMHREIGGYEPCDLDVVAAFDIDSRKVGRDLAEAVFADPNCAKDFCSSIPPVGTTVKMGRVMDGVSEHMRCQPRENTFELAQEHEPDGDDVVDALCKSGADILVNYLPVGSEEATRFYAECALKAGVGLVNCIPVFIASKPEWATRFRQAGLPMVGDDIKSQLGATILHRTLADLFASRGVELDRTYQLNTGGNTDFLNMLNRSRLVSKKESKTDAVQAVAGKRLDEASIHVGPSDYVPWQQDNKTAFIRMEGRIFGDIPVSMDMKLSVEDSPNSAGSAIDAIRCVKLALDRGDEGGPLLGPSGSFMKHPPKHVPDAVAYEQTEAFIQGLA